MGGELLQNPLIVFWLWSSPSNFHQDSKYSDCMIAKVQCKHPVSVHPLNLPRRIPQ